MLARSILLALTIFPAGRALADVPDRVTFGDDAFVRAGEHVSTVITAGGDAAIAGIVDGDVVTMGGDVVIEPGAIVHGGLATMGGDAVMQAGAIVEGDIVTMGGELVREEGALALGQILAGEEIAKTLEADPIEIVATPPASALQSFAGDVFSGLVTFGLLFVLGLLLRTFTPDRFATLQAVIVREPTRAGAMGFAGLAVTLSAILVLCVTIVGIPIAVALAIALPIVAYVGLAAAAAVIGAALPIPKLKDRPIAQLGAGVALLYLASLVPIANLVFLGLALVVGVGSIVVTRFDAVPPLPRVSHLGPYRGDAFRSDWAL